MATFHANPDDSEEPWIEKAAIEGYHFRNWHLMFFCFSAFTTLLILACCCFNFRIPRTRQEIDGDYRRKKLAEKFQERLRMIQNQDMDVIDLDQALRIMHDDFEREKQKLQEENLNLAAMQPEVTTQQPRYAKKWAAIKFVSRFKMPASNI